MTIKQIGECKIYEGYLHYVDILGLQSLAENDLEFVQYGTIPAMLVPVFGDLQRKNFLHDSRELAYIINDMMQIEQEHNFNIAFIRRVPEDGEGWKMWPSNNLGSVLITPVGDFSGGVINVDGRRIVLKAGDVLVMPGHNPGQLSPPFMIEPPEDGMMYLLTIHNMDITI